MEDDLFANREGRWGCGLDGLGGGCWVHGAG